MSSSVLNLSTKSATELAAVVGRLGATCDVQPVDPQFPLDYTLDVLTVEDFALGRARSAGGIDVTAIAAPPMLACYVPLSGPGILMLRDGPLAPTAGQIVLFNTSSLRQATFPHRHRQLFFALPVSAIEAHLRERNEREGRLFFDHLVLEQSDAIGAAMLHFSWLMLDLLAERNVVELSPIKLRRCRDGFLDLLAVALFRDKNRHFFETTPGASLNQVRRAEEFMRANCRRPISVNDVAAHLGVSVRAVQLAFRKQREATPLQVLQRFRLEGLRRDLENSPNLSVAHIAAEWGFLSSGRLSSRYRALFGETPLQTWRRIRSRGSSRADAA